MTRTRDSLTVASRLHRLGDSPSAFAVREHAEAAADEANNGEGYTERILRLSCLQRLSRRAATDGLNIGTAAVSTHRYRTPEEGLAVSPPPAESADDRSWSGHCPAAWTSTAQATVHNVSPRLNLSHKR